MHSRDIFDRQFAKKRLKDPYSIQLFCFRSMRLEGTSNISRFKMRSIILILASCSLALGLIARSTPSGNQINCKDSRFSPRSLNQVVKSTTNSDNIVPVHSSAGERNRLLSVFLSTATVCAGLALPVLQAKAEDAAPIAAAVAEVAEKVEKAVPAEVATKEVYDFCAFKLPYNHENLLFKDFLGPKATIVFNMKIDDPQTVTQFPNLLEIYKKYVKEGLNVHAFPTEQGWFEPDDDETVRAKSKEYYGFGNYPTSVVFDKVDLLGPSAHPLYSALTKSLITPNGYGRITLNYEKFLLDPSGTPVRRYPRKFTAYDMEPDILALLKGEPLPAESPAFQKAWREAKREAVKSEYSFRYNYNYYTAPDSMYKYNPDKDK